MATDTLSASTIKNSLRDSTTPKNSDAEPVDPAHRPVLMAFSDDIGIFALHERFECRLDGRRIALVEQATVTVVRVDDGPVLGVRKLPSPVPRKAFKPTPVAGHFFRRRFQIQFAQLRHVFFSSLFLGAATCCSLAGLASIRSIVGSAENKGGHPCPPLRR